MQDQYQECHVPMCMAFGVLSIKIPFRKVWSWPKWLSCNTKYTHTCGGLKRWSCLQTDFVVATSSAAKVMLQKSKTARRCAVKYISVESGGPCVQPSGQASTRKPVDSDLRVEVFMDPALVNGKRVGFCVFHAAGLLDVYTRTGSERSQAPK